MASYGGDGNRMDVFAALDDAYKNQMGNDDYYTCFVDEYYYTTNPVDNSSIALSDFINAEDRTFSLGSDINTAQTNRVPSPLPCMYCNSTPLPASMTWKIRL